MSPETKFALESFAARLLQEGNAAIDFGKEQVPLVVQEFLTWYAWSSGLMVLLGRIAYKSKTESMQIVCGLGSGASTLLSFPLLIESVGPLVKVLIAPRLVVLDFVRGLL